MRLAPHGGKDGKKDKDFRSVYEDFDIVILPETKKQMNIKFGIQLEFTQKE